MNIETTPYYINVSTNGIPFYVCGDIVCEEQIIMLKNHKKQTGLYYLFDKGKHIKKQYEGSYYKF